MAVAAILTAAGSGSRLGHALPKAFVPLGGVALVVHAARGLLAARTTDGDRVTRLVVTVPADRVEETRALLLAALPALRPVDLGTDGVVRDGVARAGVVPDRVLLDVVAGGVSRQASVAAGIAVLGDEDVVLVHDAARALTPPGLVARVVEAVRSGHRAVVPGLAVTDTVKRVGDDDGSGARAVVETVSRTALRAVQTPQGFARDLLVAAHAAGADLADDESQAASDDAGLVEALGQTVWTVPGDQAAAKITTPRDLALAAWLLDAEDR